MNAAELPDLIAAERRDLAEVLAGLTSQEWETESLCKGWRVREVVAHITMPFRYSKTKFVTEIVASRGSFTRMADRCARRDASAPTAELLAALIAHERHPWKPPGGGFAAALTHDVIHGLDVTVALGHARTVPEKRLRIALDGLTTPASLKYFGARLDGLEFRADDTDWSFGSGTLISGSAQDLALTLSGRDRQLLPS
jgi:uncharacterized protein (TIGR03083 family)